MAEFAAGTILHSASDANWARAVCFLCPWISHVGGTTHDLALVALVAHLEAAHRAVRCRIAPTGGPS